jgi:hypothetical protein
MADTRFQRDQRIRNAVEAFTNLASSSKESVEEAVLSAAYGTLCIDAGLSPGSNPRVALKLHQSGLLGKASIDHREYRKCRIDFAWPEKRVGLRVTTWPRCRTQGSVIPEFVYADAFLRGQGWLIFQVDPASKTFDEQLDRAAFQINRIGQYPGRRP